MDDSRPTTVAELMDAFGGISSFARAIGIGASTASEQKRSASIPVKYWPAIVDAAVLAGIPGVTNDALVSMHVGRTEEVRA